MIRNRLGDAPKVVHRESTQIQERTPTFTFQGARACWDGQNSDQVILALDENGSACEVWMAEEQKERLVRRLNKWKGCYGGWPIRTLNPKGD
jgi:hypothetical protein